MGYNLGWWVVTVSGHFDDVVGFVSKGIMDGSATNFSVSLFWTELDCTVGLL